MGASVINVYIRVIMPANRLRVNHYDFMALHSNYILFYMLYFLNVVFTVHSILLPPESIFTFGF